MVVRIHRALQDALRRSERPDGWTFFAGSNALAKEDVRPVTLVSLLNRQIGDAKQRLRRLSDAAERQAQLRLIDDLSRHVNREMAPARACA